MLREDLPNVALYVLPVQLAQDSREVLPGHHQHRHVLVLELQLLQATLHRIRLALKDRVAFLGGKAHVLPVDAGLVPANQLAQHLELLGS